MTAPAVPYDDLKPFFAAILADPDNDNPRLELARFLDERGDRRGEFIRLSIESEALERDDPKRVALEARIKKLPHLSWFHPKFEWNAPYQIDWRRGVIESISCSVPNFVVSAERLMELAPIREYNPLAPQGQCAELAACPALARLRRLWIDNVWGNDLRTILASPHLTKLPVLDIHWHLETPDAVTELETLLQPLTGLRDLRILGYYKYGVEKALGAFVKRRGLEKISVYNAGGNQLIIDTLCAELGDVLQNPRPAPPVTFRFGTLAFNWQKFDAKDFSPLMKSGEFRSATCLKLGIPVGDRGLDELARSGAFPNLVELVAGGAHITDTGARALAEHAVDLDHLETISLGEVPRERHDIGATDEFGVSDDGVRALALSPRLPALKTITRSKEYRHTPPESREEREVIPITRPDGTVVESVIYHSIWP